MILVTGGTGMLGSYLLLRLSLKEIQISAIYREKKTIEKAKSLFKLYNNEALFEKIIWIKADILDVPSLEIAFEKIEYVYHCAAVISFDPSDENKLRKTNIEGTANIVNFCLAKNIKKLCFVSSIAALGDLLPSEKIKTEETEWNPEKFHSDYAISKYGAEMEVMRGQQEGLNTIIVNPGVIFGAGFWENGSGAFFSSIKKGLPFFTNGKSGYVAATDVVEIMQQLMESNINGERFILISENYTYKEIIYLIARKINAKNPTIEAKSWMLEFAWRFDWLASSLFSTKRKISKYAAQSLLNEDEISNHKIKQALNFNFKKITNTINEIGELFNATYIK